MRRGLFALGALIGAGLAYYYLNRPEHAVTGETWEPRQPKHDIQGPEEREAVAALIDDVVHEPDAPDTPIKQAFEHALEER